MIDWREEVRRRLKASAPAGRQEEIVDELAQDLELRYEAMRERGMAHDEAYRALLASLDPGGVLSRNVARVEGTASPFSGIARDVRLAWRVLSCEPGFAIVGIMTLAIGIGANLAIFSLAYAALWRPLPFVSPGELVEIHERRPNGAPATYTSLPNFKDWQAATRSFDGMAAYTDSGATLTGVGDPVRLAAIQISTGVLPLIGVEPMLGRNFTEDEDRLQGAPAVILSHHLWQERFGADRTVLGRTITIEGEPRPIVGVMGPGFHFPIRPEPVDLYLPIGRDPFPLMQLRDGRLIKVIARLRGSVEQANAEMASLANRLAAAYPDTNTGWSAFVVPLRDDWFGSARQGILLLFGAVAFVLLIACANLASLMMARSEIRRRDMAVRRALGASRFQLVRQILVQSLVIAAAGGIAGAVLSTWLVDAASAIAPGNVRAADAGFGAVHSLTAIGVTLIAGLLIGIGPAWLTSRDAPLTADRGTPGGARHNRFLSVLLAAEVAAGIVLLAGAGLFTQSLSRLMAVNPGIDASDVLVVPIELPLNDYPDDAGRNRFYSAALEGIADIPGVTSVATAFPVPLGGTVAFPFTIDGRVSDRPTGAYYRSVSAGYFTTLRVPVRRGRVFNDDDRANSPQVAIINESMASQYFGDADPLGQRITIVDRNAGDRRTSREIVGVVGDVRHQGLDRPSGPEMYVPGSQAPSQWMSLAVRSARGSELVAAIAATVHGIDPALPVQGAYVLEERIARAASPRIFSARLLSAFAVAAVLLALIGIAATSAYIVAQRTPEIAVRMAVGATSTTVLAMILSGTFRVAVAGAVMGLLASAGLSGAIRGMLFEINPLDPLTLALVTAAMIALALLAGLGPARRAAAIDPVVSLRRD